MTTPTAESERIMARLRQHYAERTPLPGDPHATLGMGLLQRLMRGVTAEYGDATTTTEPRPQCGALARCAHGVRDAGGRAVHLWNCPTCGQLPAALLCYSCKDCGA